MIVLLREPSQNSVLKARNQLQSTKWPLRWCWGRKVHDTERCTWYVIVSETGTFSIWSGSHGSIEINRNLDTEKSGKADIKMVARYSLGTGGLGMILPWRWLKAQKSIREQHTQYQESQEQQKGSRVWGRDGSPSQPWHRSLTRAWGVTKPLWVFPPWLSDRNENSHPGAPYAATHEKTRWPAPRASLRIYFNGLQQPCFVQITLETQ